MRFECSHLRRGMRVAHLPIEFAAEVSALEPGPDQVVEEQEGLARILGAIRALPREERDVTLLYYLRDHSQREVAAFLNLSVATVNNRLRSARKRLKHGDLLTMTKDILSQHGLPVDFAEKVGRIVRTQGPIVDARFAPSLRPPVLNALTVTDPATNRSVTVEVAQHLDDGDVRCIVLDAPGQEPLPLGIGMTVVDTAGPISVPLDIASIRQVIAAMRRAPAVPEVLETGIKVIDVLSPLPVGGLVGLVGDMQTGKMVVVEELIHRLAGTETPLTVLVFVEARAEVTVIQRLDYRTSVAVEVIYLPVADADPAALAAATDGLDAVITFSRHLAKDRLYPAIDPLRSRSRLLDPAVVGQGNYDVAVDVKRLLEDAGSARDEAVRARARRVQRFLTQPFFVAEAFTNRTGRTVSRGDAVSGLRALLEGTNDDLTGDALYMVGTLDDAIAQRSGQAS